MRLQHNGKNYFVYLPQTFVKLKKWKKGQQFAPSFNERGNVELAVINSD